MIHSISKKSNLFEAFEYF